MTTTILLNLISYSIQLQGKPKAQIYRMISPSERELFKNDYLNPLSSVRRNVVKKLIFFYFLKLPLHKNILFLKAGSLLLVLL